MTEKILRKVAPYISSLSLLVIIFFAIQVFRGHQSKEIYIAWTNVFTVVWFVFSPFWLIPRNRKENV
ncbi:hypothetical protein JXQ31_16065 [candidate division KSB1 bacterium]|nr:hypothetical protein [candidate division KSB1 bacterium]